MVYDHAQQLLENGNPAFRRGNYDALMVVPLLITEEGGVAKTIESIRRQNVNSGVAISANFPVGGTRLEVPQKNIEEIYDYVLTYL